MSTSSPGFFEDKYRTAADPWNFARDDYELARYDAIMVALRGRRFGRAFEPGCSVGVLTERLAALCARVEACDFSPTAVGSARTRCAPQRNVTVTCAALNQDASWSRYDLVVLSEIGYYFNAEDWRALVGRMIADLQPGATVLAAHWLGQSPDHRLHGDCVHQLMEDERLRLQSRERHEGGRGGFRLDVWRRA